MSECFKQYVCELFLLSLMFKWQLKLNNKFFRFLMYHDFKKNVISAQLKTCIPVRHNEIENWYVHEKEKFMLWGRKS